MLLQVTVESIHNSVGKEINNTMPFLIILSIIIVVICVVIIAILPKSKSNKINNESTDESEDISVTIIDPFNPFHVNVGVITKNKSTDINSLF